MMQLVCDERYKIAFVKKETALYKKEVVLGQSQTVKQKRRRRTSHTGNRTDAADDPGNSLNQYTTVAHISSHVVSILMAQTNDAWG